MSADASFLVTGFRRATFFMASTYLGKSDDSAASTGALSTEMMFAQHFGFRRANVMAVFAPMECPIKVGFLSL